MGAVLGTNGGSDTATLWEPIQGTDPGLDGHRLIGTNGTSGTATSGEPVQGTVPRLEGPRLIGTNGERSSGGPCFCGLHIKCCQHVGAVIGTNGESGTATLWRPIQGTDPWLDGHRLIGTNGTSGTATLGEPVQGTVPRLDGPRLLGTNGERSSGGPCFCGLHIKFCQHVGAVIGTNGESGTATLGKPVQGTVPRKHGPRLIGTNGTSGTATLGLPVQGTVPLLDDPRLIGTNGERSNGGPCFCGLHNKCC